MARPIKTVYRSKAEVLAAMHLKLEGSDLSPADGKKLGYVATSADEAQAIPTLPAHKAGFVIPYFDLAGKKTKFWRYRYLEPTREGLSALTAKKDLRYTQPPKTVNELYLPPLRDWTKVADNAKHPILITEGELKAACACKHGFATIGLGGVWCFKASSQHMAMLPQFELFDWKNRPVYIVYDSDAVSNAKVSMAENALAKELTARGAETHIVRLPHLKPGIKCGLDDYLVLNDPEDLQAVLDDSTPWRAVQELYRLNEEVVYVEDPGLVLRLDNLQRLNPRGFCEHAYAPRIYYEEQITEKGTKLLEKSAAKEWLKWPARATARRITYAPGRDRVDATGEFNVWPGWGTEPEPGDVGPWNELLDFLFKKEESSRKWFQQWCAYPLQHPGEKLFTAAVLWGTVHGTGKSMVGYSLGRIYGRNFAEIGNDELDGTFNEWAENRQFILGEEITGGDKRHMADKLKSMITRKQIRINVKFVPSIALPDCINYLFTSNHPDAFYVEDTDRRFFIHEVQGTPRESEFYQRYYDWLDAGGAAHLFHHLLTVDVTDFSPKGHAPTTNSKRDMIDSGRSDLGSWVAQLRENPDAVLHHNGQPLGRSLWSTTELHTLYDPSGQGRVTANGLARELKRAGFSKVLDGMPVPGPTGIAQRLWAIRDPDKLLRMNWQAIRTLYYKEQETPHALRKKYSR